jgi:hypothetical protein
MIEQLQNFKANPIINPTITSQTVTLPFNHPVRYIMWVYQSNLHGIYTTARTPFEMNDAYAPLNEARIQANGVDRFTTRPGSYFNLVQPTQAVSQAPSAGIYMYSFGVMANDQDSAGTLNFSQLDTVTLHLTAKAASASTIAQVLTPDVTLDTALTKFNTIAIFAVNYNVFRVMDGLAGVMWAN